MSRFARQRKGNMNARLMENLGYYNGKCDLIENMSVPMSDRSVGLVMEFMMRRQQEMV